MVHAGLVAENFLALVCFCWQRRHSLDRRSVSHTSQSDSCRRGARRAYVGLILFFLFTGQLDPDLAQLARVDIGWRLGH